MIARVTARNSYKRYRSSYGKLKLNLRVYVAMDFVSSWDFSYKYRYIKRNYFANSHRITVNYFINRKSIIFVDA